LGHWQSSNSDQPVCGSYAFFVIDVLNPASAIGDYKKSNHALE
jgi:hypothetical protein